MQPIPVSLAPFFQEYDLAQLDPQCEANTIIQCTLQFGNRAEIHWLFRQYSRARITDWVRKYAQERLPDPHRNFQRLILEIEEGNLVAPLMKLDALLSRAARKDFYDLYFICQAIPLRTLLDLAPRKYAGIRDFEAQAVNGLVYFENAEADADPPLLQPVSWVDVKSFFVRQAKEIGTGWL